MHVFKEGKHRSRASSLPIVTCVEHDVGVHIWYMERINAYDSYANNLDRSNKEGREPIQNGRPIKAVIGPPQCYTSFLVALSVALAYVICPLDKETNAPSWGSSCDGVCG